ncbi:DUF742 domain-containing protein [Streptomyces roseochromogenus]|uniref:DUF742 domain-containing protein n=1 Tax=Streptomyces roseochromogenus subsp. oscitans DS 12.976 TaxID=1352936 RepID=V6KR80_STRRC|nr:DUF742 domain-containing protein [Streptomyces roseochromogenus]EST34607.1 hypothetical protein M878_09660 [Streptomyces roseochromogenus subsp. oscitans DS 12.976]
MADGTPHPVPVRPAPAPAPAVRPYLVTAGRIADAGSGRALPLETQVVATVAGFGALGRFRFERYDIVAAYRLPQSLAELAARLRLHLNVVRVVLAEDLCEAGQLAVYVPDAAATHDASVLRRLADFD